MFSIIIKLIRIKHWIKNLFVFVPIFISGNIFDTFLLVQSLLIFLVFCFVSSSIYVFNDILDINRDKAHPIKKNRPLASGKLSISYAILIIIILMILSLSILNVLDFRGFNVILAYIIINIIYSLYVKHVPILDIVSISTGFVLRVNAGLAVTGLSGSFWLIGLTFSLSMLLAVGKRKGELKIKNEALSRPSLKGYTFDFLNHLQGIFTTIVMIFYILYTFFTDNFPGNMDLLLYSSFFVIIGLCRYLQINFSLKSIDEPTDILYKDKFLLLIVMLWIAYILYCLG